ncbi:ROK family protein [Streptomyces sp. 147326]|uniref:ROK family protein n=1 Tax=Streptomyces sp. 147326 TaxID=3074379 RepID=UPI0038579E6E
MAAVLPRLLAVLGAGWTALALGVATGQWVDPEAGTMVHHPQLGWRGAPVRDELATATGVPVHLDSRSRALARAEQLLGEAATPGSAVVLFVGNVVDAAFVTAGAVHHGACP